MPPAAPVITATFDASRFDMHLVSLQKLRFTNREEKQIRLGTAFGVSLVVSLAVVAAADKSKISNVPLNLKVGLWRMTYTTERNGAAPASNVAPELLAKMTPEQRTRTEARLKARAAAQGVEIETKQYCLTQERLKKAIFNSEETRGCRRTMLASTAKLQQFHDECIEGGTKRSTDGRFEATDFDTVKGLLKVKNEGASSVTTNVEIAGKWIANDCGDTAQ